MHHLNLAHGQAVAALASSAIGQIGPCLQLAPCYLPRTALPRQPRQLAPPTLLRTLSTLNPAERSRSRPGRADRRFVSGLDTAVKDGDLAVIATPVHFLGGQLLLARGCRRSGSAAPDSSRLFRRLATDLSPGHL